LISKNFADGFTQYCWSVLNITHTAATSCQTYRCVCIIYLSGIHK